MAPWTRYGVGIWFVLALAACGAPGAPASPAPSTAPSAPPAATPDANTRPADGEQQGNTRLADGAQLGGAALDGTRWTLATLNGSAPVAGSIVTLSFANGNQASGNGGCNSYGGTYTATGDGTISFMDIASTLMACADAAITAQETVYVQALREAALYRVTDGRLEILNAADAPTLVFNSAGGADPATTPTVVGGE